MLLSNQWEVPIVCLPFVYQLDRLRSDCIRLGHLLEVKFGERSRKGRHEQSKKKAFTIISRSKGTTKTEPMIQSTDGGQRQKQRHLQKESRRTRVRTTENPTLGKATERQILETDSQNSYVSKSLPPTPPESARAIRHSIKGPQKVNFQVRHVPTVPHPFRFSSRSSVPCRFAQKHLDAMLEERRRKEEADRRREPFRARPVPESTYRADTDIHIGQLKRKRTMSLPDKPTQQRMPMRHRSVPLSTYIRPNSVMEETRKLRRERRAMEELSKAKGPRGMEEHSIRWHIRWRLRHSFRCLPPSSSPRHRAVSVPDFALLHSKFQQQLAANRQVLPTTIAQPFRLSVRQSVRR